MHRDPRRARGPDALVFLQRVQSNDVAKKQIGGAHYLVDRLRVGLDGLQGAVPPQPAT